MYNTFNYFAYPSGTTWIEPRTRRIPTVCKHVAANEALTGGGETIRVDEPMVYRVVISALEVIEPRLGVVVIVVIDDG